MAKETCPKCGSDDLRSWGSERRMCNNCGEIFSVEVKVEEAPEVEVTEKEDLEEFTYKPGEYLEQLKRERAQAEKEAQEAQSMFAEMADDLEDAGDEATHETEIVDVEPEEEIDEEEPEEESASAEYERLHAKMKIEQEVAERDRKAKTAYTDDQGECTHEYRSSPQKSTPQLVQQLEGIFASKPASGPVAPPRTAKKKKSSTVGCVIALVIIVIVAISIICSIAGS